VVIKATLWKHFSREQASFSYAVGLIYPTLKTWGGGEKKSAQTKKPRKFSSTGLFLTGLPPPGCDGLPQLFAGHVRHGKMPALF
jgi:hypothetical protein